MTCRVALCSAIVSRWRTEGRENKEEGRREDIKELGEKVRNEGRSVWNDHYFEGSNKSRCESGINQTNEHGIINSWIQIMAINVHLNKEQQERV